MNFEESIQCYLRLEKSERKAKQMQHMEKHFIQRTHQHISRVQDFLDTACTFYPHYSKELIGLGAKHDISKLYLPERQPYIYLTWQTHMRKKGKGFIINDKMQNRIHEMTFHHVKNNPHHPEFHAPNLKVNPIDVNDRTKRTVKIDATAMSELYLIEMVCDWSAVSEELHGNLIQWVDDSIASRWTFSESQINFIYELIEILKTD